MSVIEWVFDNVITYSNYRRTYYTFTYKGCLMVRVVESHDDITKKEEFFLNCGNPNELEFYNLLSMMNHIDEREVK